MNLVGEKSSSGVLDRSLELDWLMEREYVLVYGVMVSVVVGVVGAWHSRVSGVCPRAGDTAGV